MADWFIDRNGKEHGPVTAQQLKQLAATGQLRPDDRVRRDDMQAPRPAREIKGLFGPASKPPSLPSDPVPSASPSAKPRSLVKLTAIGCLGVFGIMTLCTGVIGVLAKMGAPKATPQASAETTGTPSPKSSRSPQNSQDSARPDQSGGKPAEAQRLLGGDPSVDFEKLDFKAIDIDRGPQGQKVVTKKETPGGTTIRRGYEGKDGKFYEHGKQEQYDFDGRFFRSDEFVYGRRHGKSLVNASPTSRLEVAIEATFFNGELRKRISWLDMTRGVKDQEADYFNGNLHGWQVYYDQNGSVLRRSRYEHGKHVETPPAEPIRPNLP